MGAVQFSGFGGFPKATTGLLATALATLVGTIDNEVVETVGNVSANDGGGGAFYWAAASVATADNLYVFGAAPAGRWIRVFEDPWQNAINAQVGVTYAVVASDNGKVVTLDNALSIAVDVPAAAVTPFVGKTISATFIQLGAGQATFTGSGGLTVTPQPGFLAKTRGAGSAVTLKVLSATSAILGGDLAFV